MSPSKPARWRCHSCGELLTAWAAAERHADQNRHHRIEVLLDER